MAPLSRTYRILRAVVRGALRLFFREIAVEGREHLPTDRGGLLVAWHPNGVIDPGLILAAFPGQVVFGARDGLLRWPVVGWVMRTLGTVPIYRPQDHSGESDADRREANARSLDALATAVARGSFSALFPEGQSHDDPHPAPLRSGAARLFLRACSMASGGSLGAGTARGAPVIVPVGLHYDDKAVFRSDVLVVFHPPLALPPEADARAVTAAIEDALVQATHATEDWDLHRTMLRAAGLVRAEAAAREGRHAEPASIEERRLDFDRMWRGYHARRKTHPDEIAALRREVSVYRRQLDLLGLNDAHLDRRQRSAPTRWLATVGQGLLAYLVLRPLLIVGTVVNAPPYWALKPLARRFSGAEKDTATVKLLGGMVLFPLAWLVAGLLAAWGVAPLREIAPWVPDAPLAIGLGAVGLSIAGAVVALRGSELTVDTWRALRARWTRLRHADRIADLRQRRADLFDRLVALDTAPEASGV